MNINIKMPTNATNSPIKSAMDLVPGTLYITNEGDLAVAINADDNEPIILLFDPFNSNEPMAHDAEVMDETTSISFLEAPKGYEITMTIKA